MGVKEKACLGTSSYRLDLLLSFPFLRLSDVGSLQSLGAGAYSGLSDVLFALVLCRLSLFASW